MIENPTRGAGLAGLATWAAETFGREARLKKQLEKVPELMGEDVLEAMRTNIKEVMGLEGHQTLIVDGIDWQTHGTRRIAPYASHSRVTEVQIDHDQELEPVGRPDQIEDQRLKISLTPWRYRRDVSQASPLDDPEVMSVWLETVVPDNVNVGLFTKVGMSIFRQELQAAQLTA